MKKYIVTEDDMKRLRRGPTLPCLVAVPTEEARTARDATQAFYTEFLDQFVEELEVASAGQEAALKFTLAILEDAVEKVRASSAAATQLLCAADPPKAPEPQPDVSYKEAMEAVRYGQRVTRGGWGSGVTLYKSKDVNFTGRGMARVSVEPMLVREFHHSGELFPWKPTEEDMFAKDWRVVV